MTGDAATTTPARGAWGIAVPWAFSARRADHVATSPTAHALPVQSRLAYQKFADPARAFTVSFSCAASPPAVFIPVITRPARNWCEADRAGLARRRGASSRTQRPARSNIDRAGLADSGDTGWSCQCLVAGARWSLLAAGAGCRHLQSSPANHRRPGDREATTAFCGR